jgi:hypothetical protein
MNDSTGKPQYSIMALVLTRSSIRPAVFVVRGLSVLANMRESPADELEPSFGVGREGGRHHSGVVVVPSTEVLVRYTIPSKEVKDGPGTDEGAVLKRD